MMTGKKPQTNGWLYPGLAPYGTRGRVLHLPEVQREAIHRWATYRQVTIAEWHVDEDESGGTQNRPGLRRALERVEARETDGIAS